MSKNNTAESEELTDAMYYILLALMKERHGYAIMKYVEELTQGRVVIGPGMICTLFTGQASKEGIFICVIVMSLNWNVYNSIKKQAHIHQHPRKSNNILLDIKLENGQECMINTDLIS